MSLDFVNTLEWRRGTSPNERLVRVPNLIEWALESGLIDGDRARRMQAAILKNPDEAGIRFEKILHTREMIYRIFSAISKNGLPSGEDFNEYNAILARSLAQTQLVLEDDQYRWGWKGGADSLEVLLWMIVRSAAELLTSTDLRKLGECADDRGCAYLFLDESRNHSRRWCSMESCGNRAKARRHYKRKNAKATS